MSPDSSFASLNLGDRPVADDLSVVIPTLGREILHDSLAHIAQGSLLPKEIIVVDQGRTVHVRQWLDQLSALGLGTRCVPSVKRGRSAGLNEGLACVGTRFVAITDDDCFVDALWLENMRKHLVENPRSAVTGRVQAGGQEEVVMTVSSTSPAVYTRPRLTFDSLSGGNMGTSMEVFSLVGGFDEHPSVQTAEDGEWAYRALRRGVRLVYAPDVLVVHFGWRDNQQRDQQYRDYARSQGGFYAKYLLKADWFIALRLVIHLVRALRWLVGGLLARDHERSQVGRAYLSGLLPGVLSGLRQRVSDQS